MSELFVDGTIPRKHDAEDKIFNLCCVEIKEFPEFVTNFTDIVGPFHRRLLSPGYKDLNLDHVSIRENGELVHIEHHSILATPYMDRDFEYLISLHRASGLFIHPFLFNTGEIPKTTIEFASPTSFYNPVFVNTKEIEGTVRLNNINYKLNNNQQINTFDILDLIWMPTYRWDREIESVVMELIDIYNNLIVDERLLEVLRKSLVLWAGKYVYDEKNLEKVKGGLNMSAQEVINLEKDIIDARIDGIVSRAEKAALDEGMHAGMEEGKKIGREEGKKIGREEGKKIGREEGKKIGREDGINDTKLETAKNMLAKGFSIEDIGDVTGLSEDVINSLF